jgi:dTDP-4-amino-4,6-dideoxygalactose transaminase
MYVRPNELKAAWTRDRIIQEVNAGGVPCYQGSCSEVYRERAFDNTNWRPQQRLSNAQELGETSLMFLVHPTLEPEEIDLTCRVLAEVLAQASN